MTNDLRKVASLLTALPPILIKPRAVTRGGAFLRFSWLLRRSREGRGLRRFEIGNRTLAAPYNL
jgi:hypothetical protein